MELYEKIYVAPAFLETTHGEIACETCHGGDPADGNWQTAHKGIVRDPTFPDPARACGDCHREIVASAARSLHYTLAPMYGAVLNRCRKDLCSTGEKERMERVMDRHCGTCHASCGQCHVSRPDYVKGGFLSKHGFKKQPPMDTTCASCHGGRVYGAFTGDNEDFLPDVHFEDQEMVCMDCHTMAEMHADATGVKNRYLLPEKPACIHCHEDAAGTGSANEYHAAHKGKLSCQVCHSQAAKNCFSCHVGTDKQGLPYFKCEKTAFLLKIGRNPFRTDVQPFEFTLVRHVPVSPDTFKFYEPEGLARFSELPTWKMATPHNIRRKTEQTRTCNSCHGRPALFLREQDLAPSETAANRKVMVPAERIPGKLPE